MKTNPFLRLALPAACAAAMVFYMCATAFPQDAAPSSPSPAPEPVLAALRAAAEAATEASAAADAKAADLAQQEAKEEEELKAAGKAAKDASTLAAEKAAALADAKAKAAADPSSAALAAAVKKAAAESDDAAHALAALKTEAQVKVARLLAVADEAKEAAKAAAAAKPVVEVALTQVEVQGWVDDSAAQSKKGHLVALVIVHREGQKLRDFRYDRFASVERVVTSDGGFFARPAGKGWMESWDWGKTGAPVAEKQGAALDAMVGMVQGAFQPAAPDAQEGAPVWKRAPDGNAYHFDQGREKPRPNAVYPGFEFARNSMEGTGILLRTVTAQWKWEDQPQSVTVRYFYRANEAAPPEGEPPEARVAEALRATAAKPVKVDLEIDGRDPVSAAGIISGKDFDLTIQHGGRTWRQIAAGEDCWTSADGGKTWQKQKETDRTYYDAAHLAMGDELLAGSLQMMQELAPPPFRHLRLTSPANAAPPDLRRFVMDLEAVDEGEGSGGEVLEIGTTVQGFLNYSLVMKDGKAVALRSVISTGALAANIAGTFQWAYSEVADGKGVLPPPGNPEALPGMNANTALAQAVKAMEAAGVWRVEYLLNQQEQTNGIGKPPGEPKLVQRISGLISGVDFDLTNENPANATKQTARWIGIKDTTWLSTDGGTNWNEITANAAQPRGAFIAVRWPLDQEPSRMRYEIAGTETHDGETWLHIRASAGPPWQEDTSEIWIQLDQAGKAVAVRRCKWVSGGGEWRNSNEETFTPAKAEIKPPEAAK